MNEDVHLKLLVPYVAAGAIIGKGGEAVETIKRLTGARLKMSKANDFYPGTTERICLIIGSAQACMQLGEYIMKKVAERPELVVHAVSTVGPVVGQIPLPTERHNQIKILVPNSTVGVIIGKSGSFIKQIKEKSGAFVQISQRPKELKLMERCIVITGDLEERRTALSMILTKIAEDPDSRSYPNCSYVQIQEPVASAFPTGSPFAFGIREAGNTLGQSPVVCGLPYLPDPGWTYMDETTYAAKELRTNHAMLPPVYLKLPTQEFPLPTMSTPSVIPSVHIAYSTALLFFHGSDLNPLTQSTFPSNPSGLHEMKSIPSPYPHHLHHAAMLSPSTPLDAGSINLPPLAFSPPLSPIAAALVAAAAKMRPPPPPNAQPGAINTSHVPMAWLTDVFGGFSVTRPGMANPMQVTSNTSDFVSGQPGSATTMLPCGGPVYHTLYQPSPPVLQSQAPLASCDPNDGSLHTQTPLTRLPTTAVAAYRVDNDHCPANSTITGATFACTDLPATHLVDDSYFVPTAAAAHGRYWSGESTDSALTESLTSVRLNSSTEERLLESAPMPMTTQGHPTNEIHSGSGSTVTGDRVQKPNLGVNYYSTNRPLDIDMFNATGTPLCSIPSSHSIGLEPHLASMGQIPYAAHVQNSLPQNLLIHPSGDVFCAGPHLSSLIVPGMSLDPSAYTHPDHLFSGGPVFFSCASRFPGVPDSGGMYTNPPLIYMPQPTMPTYYGPPYTSPAYMPPLTTTLVPTLTPDRAISSSCSGLTCNSDSPPPLCGSSNSGLVIVGTAQQIQNTLSALHLPPRLEQSEHLPRSNGSPLDPPLGASFDPEAPLRLDAIQSLCVPSNLPASLFTSASLALPDAIR